MRTLAALVVFALSAVAAAVAFGRQRFAARVDAEVAGLFSGPLGSVGPEQLHARWQSLPEPVRRYLRYAVPAGAPAITTARLRHAGTFRTAPGQPWLAIEGEQYFTAASPGFVWRASIRPARVMWIEARDRLAGGRGHMLVKLMSAIPLADASGPEIDQGASLRWLGECTWFPYAFVGDHVEWTPIDGHSARATLRQPDLVVEAVVHVDDDGRLTRCTAERYRDVGGGKAVLTPFVGRCSDYRTFNGFRVPSLVEASWVLDDGEFTYARFQVTTLEYNQPSRFDARAAE